MPSCWCGSGAPAPWPRPPGRRGPGGSRMLNGVCHPPVREAGGERQCQPHCVSPAQPHAGDAAQIPLSSLPQHSQPYLAVGLAGAGGRSQWCGAGRALRHRVGPWLSSIFLRGAGREGQLQLWGFRTASRVASPTQVAMKSILPTRNPLQAPGT